MTRRAYLYFTLTIVLGAVLGGSGTYYYFWNSGRLNPGGFSKARAKAHLKKELSLSDSELQQIDHIFDESSKKMADLHGQVDPQFQAIHQETRARIRQILDPDQARKFDEFVRQIDERRKRRPRPE